MKMPCVKCYALQWADDAQLVTQQDVAMSAMPVPVLFQTHIQAQTAADDVAFDLGQAAHVVQVSLVLHPN